MSEPRPPDEVLGYYDRGGESGRLEEASFPLERARTEELLRRHLSPPPGVVLDVGGAAGAYALWLADAGYEVHLVDPVPLHVRQAEEASRSRPGGRLASARLGDLVRRVEREPSLLGASPHLLAVGRR